MSDIQAVVHKAKQKYNAVEYMHWAQVGFEKRGLVDKVALLKGLTEEPFFLSLYEQLQHATVPPKLSAFDKNQLLTDIVKLSAPTVRADVQNWLVKLPNVELYPTLLAAAQTKNWDVVDDILATKQWSARPVASLLPYALLDDSHIDTVLNYPSVKGNKDSVVFFALMHVHTFKPNEKNLFWNALMQQVIGQLSADNIAQSLQMYKNKNGHHSYAEEFLDHLSNCAQHKKISEQLHDLTLQCAPAKRKKL